MNLNEGVNELDGVSWNNVVSRPRRSVDFQRLEAFEHLERQYEQKFEQLGKLC